MQNLVPLLLIASCTADVDTVLEWDGIGPSVISMQDVDRIATSYIRRMDLEKNKRHSALILLRRGIARFHLNRFEEADDDLRIVCEEIGNAHQAKWHQARIRSRMSGDRLAKALSWANDHMKTDPRSPLGFRIAAACGFRGGQLEKAISLLDAAIERDASDSYTHYMRGRILLELRRPQESLASFERSLGLAPMLVETECTIVRAKGITLLRLKRFPEAVLSLRKSQALDPSDIVTRASLWKALVWQGKTASAEFVARQLVESNYDSSTAHLVYALSLAEKGDLNRARVQATRATELANDNSLASALSVLARVSSREGDWQGATKAYERLVDLGRRGYNPDWYLHFALLYSTCPDKRFRAGDMARRYARACVKTFKKSDNLRVAMIVLAVAEAECGEFDKALETLKKARAIEHVGNPVHRLDKLQELFRNRNPYRLDPKGDPKKNYFSLPLARTFDDDFFF